jgi:hypothetical protein
MVRKINVSRHSGTPPQREGEDRKIAGGPLYPPDEVLALLANGAVTLRPWTNGCIKDMQKWGFDIQDALELMQQAVSQGQFLGAEWCEQKPSGPWAACDAYRFQRLEWIAYARKDFRVEYYIKFAIAKTGLLVLMVSCHPCE